MKAERKSGMWGMLIGVIWTFIALYFWRPLALLPALVEIWSENLGTALGKGLLSSIVLLPLSVLPFLIVVFVWIPVGLGGPYVFFKGLNLLITGTRSIKEKESPASQEQELQVEAKTTSSTEKSSIRR